MILIGLIGVIKCGDSPEDEPMGSHKLIGEPQKAPAQIMYNVLRMG